MFWQTRYLMAPQFQGVYATTQGGTYHRIGGRRAWLATSYLCSDGSTASRGESVGAVAPNGVGEWWASDGTATGPRFRCPIAVAGDVRVIAAERRLVRAVRPSRLQHMTEADAAAEGVAPLYERTKRTGREVWSHLLGFRSRWDATAPEGAKWGDNPWVWVVMHEPETPQ